MYTCNKSFPTCPWRQKPPNNFGQRRVNQPQACLSVSGGCGDHELWGSVLCHSRRRSAMEDLGVHHMAPSASPCARCSSLRPLPSRPPRRFRAGRGACVWASVSPFPPFGKQREESRVQTHILPSAIARRSVPPSILQTGWAHTILSTQHSWLQAGSKSVSKGARLPRHSDAGVCPVLHGEGPTAGSLSSLPIVAAFKITDWCLSR